MTWKLEEPMTRERFAGLCSRHTRKEIAEQLGITIWSVIHYEKRFDCKPQSGFRRPSREKFAALAARHTKAEIARICDATYNAVANWESMYGIKCRPAPRGGQPGRPRYVTAPYRLSWLVQGGVWEDLRHCGGNRG